MNNIEFQIERRILRIGNQLNNIRIKDLKEQGLTTAQSETLLFFDANPHGTITQLKEHLQVTHQAARKIVEKLKEKAYLETFISKEDARTREVVLTSQGSDICSELKVGGKMTGERLLTTLSAEEKRQLWSLLDKISKNPDFQ